MKTKRLGFLVVCAMFLVLTGFSSRSDAEVNVGIGINIPTVGIGVNIPAYTFAAPPPVAVIPGTNVYVAPEANIDIVFYHGYWYRPYEGRTGPVTTTGHGLTLLLQGSLMSWQIYRRIIAPYRPDTDGYPMGS